MSGEMGGAPNSQSVTKTHMQRRLRRHKAVRTRVRKFKDVWALAYEPRRWVRNHRLRPPSDEPDRSLWIQSILDVGKFVRMILGLYARRGQKDLLAPLNPAILADSPLPYEDLRSLGDTHKYFDARIPWSWELPDDRNALKARILNLDLPQSTRPIFPRDVPRGFPDEWLDVMLTAPEVRRRLQPIWQTLREAWSWPLVPCRTCKGRVIYGHGRTKDCRICRRDFSKQQRWYLSKRKISSAGRAAPNVRTGQS